MTSAGAEASNYPFTTIEPNVGMVVLPDERLSRLAGLVNPEKVTPTAVEFVDIAGLVKGASRGEGLGNRFLGHIREVDMVAHIVRCFEDPQVTHVAGRVDPTGDIDVIETELMLADLDTVTRRYDKTKKIAKSGDRDAVKIAGLYEEVKLTLEDGRPVRSILTGEKAELLKDLNLLTAKPVIYVANVGEDDLTGEKEAALAVRGVAEKNGAGFAVICGDIESEIAELPAQERREFLKGLGLKESGLDRLAREAYKLLGLMTFFTAGPKEVRAWTVKQGAKAPQAAGVIHSDFERGFIKAEVIAYDAYMNCGSEAACRDKGLIRMEGKDYVLKDADIMHFRFSA